ncbi:MAG TPA: D-lyxose/D-mannose family sugar isomerase [Candidatus Baltobacteraceae bacterium]|nr:D-lyxose/D-mannose family sugar isomerase [Candidatus Baltobacteraceae bacterium]
MKCSEINRAYDDACACFRRHAWALPPRPRWDITDFGLGNFAHFGLTLVNLATEPEYCEKLMYARRRQTTPCHTHVRKKEDIICRVGELTLRLWPARPVAGAGPGPAFVVPVNGSGESIVAGGELTLAAGSRVTLVPGVWHEFWARTAECIIGEVSTANDDLHDNCFLDPGIGRFPGLEEDEPLRVALERR